MKTLKNAALVFLFTLSALIIYGQVDDCPCRPKVFKKAVIKKVPEPPKKAPVRHPLFYDYSQKFVNDFTCPRGAAKEIQSYKVKIMPNPVMDIINIIYTTPYKSLVTIELLACDGTLIKTLLSEVQEGGVKVRSFELDDKVKRGIAYIRLSSPKISKTEQIFKL